MGLSSFDLQQLRAALELARQSIGLTEPNPRVGCLLGHADGRIVGRGATQAPGAAHAEIMALRDAQAAGASTTGATAWVTLEPCAHHGRTPPCCDALIAAGITRCVVAVGDPFPAVAGAGIARMRAAGIQVDLCEDSALVAEARELNIGFFSRVQRGRPWVRVKVAASIDGRTALADGRSKWITGDRARADGHVWRKRASAVLTGIGTVLADDPRLDVRAVATPNQPLRIVLDSRGRLPETAAILHPPGRVLVVMNGLSTRSAALRAAGVEVWDEWPVGGPHSRLEQLLRRLAAEGHNEIHLEAGPTLTGAFVAEGLADELLLYTAPLLIGPGLPLAHLPPLRDLPSGWRGEWIEATLIGADLRLRMRLAAVQEDTLVLSTPFTNS